MYLYVAHDVVEEWSPETYVLSYTDTHTHTHMENGDPLDRVCGDAHHEKLVTRDKCPRIVRICISHLCHINKLYTHIYT